MIPPGSRVLEIGAGQGAIGARLARRYRYTGLEPDLQSARVAATRIAAAGGTLHPISLEALAPDERFDAVCAFEVLEHLADDAGALRSWCSHLTPGGWLVLSVPAFQHRFAAADHLVGHFRRYDPAALHGLLADAGLTDVRLWVTGFPLGNLLERGRNLLATLRPKRSAIETRTLESGRWHQPPPALGLATEVVTLPFRYLQRPFARTRLGTGLVARARRPA